MLRYYLKTKWRIFIRRQRMDWAASKSTYNDFVRGRK